MAEAIHKDGGDVDEKNVYEYRWLVRIYYRIFNLYSFVFDLEYSRSFCEHDQQYEPIIFNPTCKYS